MKHTRTASLEVRFASAPWANANLEVQQSNPTNPNRQLPPDKKVKRCPNDAAFQYQSSSPENSLPNTVRGDSCPGCKDCMVVDPIFDRMQRAFNAFCQRYTPLSWQKTAEEASTGSPYCNQNTKSETPKESSDSPDWKQCIKCESLVARPDGLNHMM